MLNALGAVTGLLPVIFAVELARAVLPLTQGIEIDAARVWLLVGGLVVGVVVGSMLSGWGYGVSHDADAKLSEDLRQRQVGHLLTLPLNWFTRTSSGRVKKVVQDDVAKTHQLIAHAVPDITSAVVVPVASLGYLFWLDWRMASSRAYPWLPAWSLRRS
ncbi:ABC transporter transmembrane domain-containing protein [Micromonospora craniellae]|uniref:ABC transporter transmembrane domain-containing protein n=1 Tax=Micromonospora craniellae TaxID=2294034 RepID=UPI002D7A1CBD|nr:ABC transporter transmembrane domain-containing protein [Micromonospora craniellae]